MLSAMDSCFPPGMHYTRPKGGLFLWGVMPPEMDAKVVLQRAVEEQVAFVPGESFFPCGGGHNTMRLNFSNARPELIREGINRLGHVLSELMEERVPVI